MLIRNRKIKLGMCYFAEPNPNAGAGGVGGEGGNDDKNQNQDKDQNKEAKFTQDDLNKLLQERLASEKTKHQKELEDLKSQMERDAELAKMSEIERAKAEAEDYKAKWQKSQDEIALNNQTIETRKLLKEANLSDDFLKFVLVPKDENQTKVNINNLKTVFEAEIKKGVEAQIKPHKPSGSSSATVGNDNNRNSGPSYSGFNLQNSVAEYYANQK